MTKNAAIKVSGLNELRKGLKEAGDNFPAELKAANIAVVEQIVIPEAKQRAGGFFARRPGQKPVHVGQAVIDSLRAVKSVRGAYIALGSNKVPWAAGYEFGSLGGKTAKGGHTSQFAPWKGNKQGAGYFVWPAITAKREEIRTRYLELLSKLTAEAFPD
jgi:hypothetical protein